MQMPIFTEYNEKMSLAQWKRDPELCLIDSILDQNPGLIQMLAQDVTAGQKASNFGRKDMPSVEQIVRAALYKELKGYDYRELGYAQLDSRMCALFVKLSPDKHYSFQMYQQYISKISEENLNKFMVELNRLAISWGIESCKQLRQDSFVVESDVHHPTNNSLIWDCIDKSDRLLRSLQKEIEGLSVRDYRTEAKRTYANINYTKSADKRLELFQKQLTRFTKAINQVSNVIKKKTTL
jgi:transposase, IS5 family